MTSTITSALSSSIGFIQLKLSDFGQEEIDFGKIIDERFQNVETSRNVNQKLELLKDNHMDYLNPVCPYCDSHNVIKQEYRDRNLILENQKPVKVYLRRYKCKSCKKKFITSLDSIIESGYRYPTILKDKLKELFQIGYRSLRNASENLLNFFGIKISYQTIHNWQQITTKNQIQNIGTYYSGYYCYDEQYVKINGVWMYRLTLFDHIFNIPVSEKIAPDKEYNTIKQFILESTNNIPLIAITTDHVPEYKNIMDELNVKHQLCIFHFYKMIGDKLYKPLRSKRTSEEEKYKLKKYFKEIRKIFDTNNYKTATKDLEELLKCFDDIPRVLQRFITKKYTPQPQQTHTIHAQSQNSTNIQLYRKLLQTNTTQSPQKEIQNHQRTNQLPKTQNAKMDHQTPKTSPTPNNLTTPE